MLDTPILDMSINNSMAYYACVVCLAYYVGVKHALMFTCSWVHSVKSQRCHFTFTL